MTVNQWKLEGSLDNANPINQFFTIKELKEAIMSGANTTPGRDRLSYKLFKHLDDMVLEDILALFNTVWAGGCLPKEWKHAVVVPILKPGKGSQAKESQPLAATPLILYLTLPNIYLSTQTLFCNLIHLLIPPPQPQRVPEPSKRIC